MSQYFDLVKKMSFLRNGGTDDELRAANILLEEIEKGGGKGELMDFQIPYFNLEKDRKSTRLNSSHTDSSRMPSSA